MFKRKYFINNIYAVVEKSCCYIAQSLEINTIPPLAIPTLESIGRQLSMQQPISAHLAGGSSFCLGNRVVLKLATTRCFEHDGVALG